jgi:hypothetical protein
MSTESIGVLDQEESMAVLFVTAEREFSAFVIAVNQLFDGDQGLKAANNWIEELERTDWLSEASAVDLRKVTIAAAAKFVWSATPNSAKVKSKERHLRSIGPLLNV